MLSHHGRNSFLLVFYSFLMLVFGRAIEKRGSDVGLYDAVQTIQWFSNSNTIVNFRNYHIRQSDGMIMEASRTIQGTTDSGWSTPGSLGFYAYPGGGLASTLVKLDDKQIDVEIRLFFNNATSVGTYETGEFGGSPQPMYPLASIVYKYGWSHDAKFNYNVGYAGTPHSAISWIDSSGNSNYRLYWSSRGRTSATSWVVAALDIFGGLDGQAGGGWTEDEGLNTIYEIQASSGNGWNWSIGNGGGPVAKATSVTYEDTVGSVAAVVWEIAGSLTISVFYWDNPNVDAARPGQIREVRYTASNNAWKLQGIPNNDFTDFAPSGALAAVAWNYPDGSGNSGLRLYVKWDNECLACNGSPQGLRMVEFSGTATSWSGQSEMSQKSLYGTTATTPISALSFVVPGDGLPNIMLFQAGCSNSFVPFGFTSTCNGAWITEYHYYPSESQWLQDPTFDV